MTTDAMHTGVDGWESNTERSLRQEFNPDKSPEVRNGEREPVEHGTGHASEGWQPAMPTQVPPGQCIGQPPAEQRTEYVGRRNSNAPYRARLLERRAETSHHVG